jgi:uncharacterized protein YndB with AHSA1/START domain
MDYNTYEDSVHRTVVKNSLESRTVAISQSFPAGLDTVWDAITKPEELENWFAPVSGDLRLNGRYSITGNASGSITACNPPHSFALTWEFCHGKSVLAVDLGPAGENVTKLTLKHTFDVDDHWRKYGPGAGGVGWDMSLLGLALYIRGLPKPSEEEWMASKEAAVFTEKSSGAWMEAAQRAGEDEVWAKEAAERTTAFYVPGWEPKK